ncbi:MAG: glycosyltransferase family 1 protein [Candidatus Zixiibacteriota bacterium]
MARQIFINGRFLSQAITGVQRYAAEIVKGIDEIISLDDSIRRKFQFSILAPKGVGRELNLKNISLNEVGRRHGHLWEQLELPFHSRKGILVNLCNMAPILKRQQTVTIHDVAVFAMPHAYTRSFRIWYRFIFRTLRVRPAEIITDTTFSASEIKKYLPAKEKRVTVIPAGCEHISDVTSDHRIISRLGLTSGNYLLAVSSLNERKNFRGFLAAMGQRDFAKYQTVVVGNLNKKIFGDSAVRLPENIVQVAEINDAELKALYANAGVFVYPSFYEGFGLPPLEAMVCGAPAVVSDIPAHREVCGEAALYCNPYEIKDIAEKIEKVLLSGDIREEMIAKGKERAEMFSWKKSAQKLLDLISERFSP